MFSYTKHRKPFTYHILMVGYRIFLEMPASQY